MQLCNWEWDSCLNKSLKHLLLSDMATEIKKRYKDAKWLKSNSDETKCLPWERSRAQSSQLKDKPSHPPRPFPTSPTSILTKFSMIFHKPFHLSKFLIDALESTENTMRENTGCYNYDVKTSAWLSLWFHSCFWVNIALISAEFSDTFILFCKDGIS